MINDLNNSIDIASLSILCSLISLVLSLRLIHRCFLSVHGSQVVF